MDGTRVKVPDEQTDEIPCELCGRENGDQDWAISANFLPVPAFPECKNTRKRLVQDTGGVCPLNAAVEVLAKKSKRRP